MKATIRGIKSYDFTNNEGEQVVGINYFVTYKDEAEKELQGETIGKIAIRGNGQTPAWKIGDMINVAYNRSGKLTVIQ